MDITYLGHSSFKIKGKTATVITDPFDSQMVGLKYSGVEGDIISVSHNHRDHNATEKVSGAKKIVEGPGEYEIMGVSIFGYPSFHDAKKGEERGRNTIYVYEIDGLKIAHLGDLGHTLTEDLVNEIGDVDILMIPVGGEYTIGPKEAVEVINAIEPFFVIPMHYKTTGMNPDLAGHLSELDVFLKESELQVETLPKFSVKKEDILEDQNTKIVVLERK